MNGGILVRPGLGDYYVAIVNNIQSFFRNRLFGSGATKQWPFVAGRYRVFDSSAPIVIVGATADSVAEELAALEVSGVCMVAPQCRSVGDAEKLVKNIAANLAIHNVLILAEDAAETPTLSALHALLGGDTSLPEQAEAVLRKLRNALVDIDLGALGRQVRSVTLPAKSDIDKIIARIGELASDANRPNTGFMSPAQKDDDGIERVLAANNIAYDQQADKAGNFYICVKGKKLVVEHFSAKNDLLRVIEGQTARDLCITLIRNGWVSRLDHAAWLGRELLRAELAMGTGEQFVPDRTMTLKLSDEDLTRH